MLHSQRSACLLYSLVDEWHAQEVVFRRPHSVPGSVCESWLACCYPQTMTTQEVRHHSGAWGRGARAGAQVCTQRSWKRPFGVGLLVAGYDKAGAKLFYCCPSGSYYDYKAMAIGARSQAR